MTSQAVHTDVGNQMVGAKVNGKPAPVSQTVANADVIEIRRYEGAPSKFQIASHMVSPLCCALRASPARQLASLPWLSLQDPRCLQHLESDLPCSDAASREVMPLGYLQTVGKCF